MKRIAYILPVLMLPMVAHAQFDNITDIIEAIGNIVETALPIVVGIALLAFFWGLAKFIFAAGNEEKKDEGKRIMIWGALAIFVMVSIFGIVEFIGNAFGIQQDGEFDVPTVEGL